jgi:hypothetical protein
MMSRFIHIVFSFFFLAVTTGFSVSRHFCHDRLVNTGLFSPVTTCSDIPDSCCEGKTEAHCGTEISKDDCCKNENEVVKFSEQFTLKQSENPAKKMSSWLQPAVIFFSFQVVSGKNPVQFLAPAPVHPPAKVLRTLLQSFLL